MDAESKHAHGTRLRYHAGCRCSECRGANTAYERERAAERRAGQPGFVGAQNVRRHLLKLQRLGIGRRTMADASGVAESRVHAILKGRVRRLTAKKAARLLALDESARADRNKVPADRTQQLVAELVEEGYTKQQLADLRGTVRLQLGKERVTARMQHDIEKLHRRLTC